MVLYSFVKKTSRLIRDEVEYCSHSRGIGAAPRGICRAGSMEQSVLLSIVIGRWKSIHLIQCTMSLIFISLVCEIEKTSSGYIDGFID